MKFFLTFILLLGTTAQAQSWKGLVIAGSKAQHVFDNARMSVSTLLTDMGIPNITLSSDEGFITIDPEILPATPMNIVYGFNKLQRRVNDRCFIYITSHGLRNQGVMMNGKVASPRVLDNYIYKACRGAPSVIVISACYSGLFIEDERFARPDRIILTASAHDRSSFGCTNDEIYTYYDNCFIGNFKDNRSWLDLHTKVKKCVRAREDEMNAERKKQGLRPYLRSYPQLFIGDMLESN